MDKKTAWGIVILTLICMCGLPIVINGLMFRNYFPVMGDEVTWISSLSSIWGAIIGGLISGILTLLGVRYTITKQERKDVINSYPERRKLGDDVSSLVIEVYRTTKKFLDDDKIYMLAGYLKNILADRDTLLDKASKVSDEVYEGVRSDFLVNVRDLYSFIGNGIEKTEEIKLEKYPYYISELNKNSINIISALDKITEEYKKIKKDI